MYGDRGLALARKLAQMRRQGCNIRLVYAMFGGEVLRIMRAAKIPLDPPGLRRATRTVSTTATST